MCFVASLTEEIRATFPDGKFQFKIAEENIPVWKRLYDMGHEYLSPYQAFSYKRGETYTSDLVIEGEATDALIVNKGLHSYSNLEKAHRGCVWNEDVVEMYIPKGAKYWESGTWEEYVSDSLVFKTHAEGNIE
jgi:hypothetical protein